MSGRTLRYRCFACYIDCGNFWILSLFYCRSLGCNHSSGYMADTYKTGTLFLGQAMGGSSILTIDNCACSGIADDILWFQPSSTIQMGYFRMIKGCLDDYLAASAKWVTVSCCRKTLLPAGISCRPLGQASSQPACLMCRTPLTGFCPRRVACRPCWCSLY